ncbi:Forkhead-associated (FHA) domain-containing protein [Euphorbia peplus]|nr:Forkhead-associated (FHA) domain-containing protein [Euphorbia peplus]
MGALAPVFSWIPEDDVLLKNAVEAGASLESLAKGAVQFSRKFTVRELQDRWHSLLYDPIISAEASFNMIEFERSSKFIRAGNSRENKFVSGKRKGESVRNCYYSLRKRIRNQPFNSMDLSFLIAPPEDNYMESEHCILGDPVSDHFGFQESNTDIMQCDFPEIRDEFDTNDFHAEFQNIVQEDYSVEQDNVHTETAQICGENISRDANGTTIEEFGGPKDLSTNAQVNGCSKFEGEHDFSSSIAGCAASFHNLQYLSPLPEMPIWSTVEGVSPPTIPLNLHTGDAYSLHGDGDAKNTCLSEFDMHRDSNLELEIPCEDMKTITGSTEVYLAELSNSLLNFTNEEELLFTDDGKDPIDKSYYDGLSSLLLSSPTDANQDHTVDVTHPEINLDYLKDQVGVSHGGVDQDEGPHHNNHVIVNSEVELFSNTLASNSQPLEPMIDNEFMVCLLNTEDPEIPNNDDVVFSKPLRPKPFFSVARRNFQDGPKLNINTNERVLALSQSEQEPPTQSITHSQIMRSQVIPETSSLHPVDDSGIKNDLPISSSAHRSVGNASKDVNVDARLPPKPNEETPEIVAMKHFNLGPDVNVVDCSKKKPAVGVDGHKSSQSNSSDAPQQIQQYQASHVELGSVGLAASKHIPTDQVLDAEELPLESDDDVPYFSDIEAMILDMDLDPEDQDLYSSDEVLRYQQEDTKRVIVRLEQGAQSYMQRAIESQEAFAVLYGRHSKHYIKKPEVLLGRGSGGVIVDIDLWREGRGNKVSRRQATINLDKSGSFHLRNLGKWPILVNEKEIGCQQSLTLPSSCLIEIRGMPFIFETNHTRVQQYLGSATQQK